MKSYTYAMFLLNDLFPKILGPKTTTGGARRAFGEALALRKKKGEQAWRGFIKQQGISVYGAPIPGHSPSAFLDISGPPVLVVDNSVPESRQDVAMVKQYLHLEMQHARSGYDECQDVEASIGAFVATRPDSSNQDQLDSYLDENPEMKEVSRGFAAVGTTLLVLLGAVAILTVAKGTIRCLKGA